MRFLSQKDVFAFLGHLQYTEPEIYRAVQDRLQYKDYNRLVITEWPKSWSKEIIQHIYTIYKEIHDDFMRRNGIKIIEELNDSALE